MGADFQDFLREVDSSKTTRVAGVVGVVGTAAVSFGIFARHVEKAGIEVGSASFNAMLVGIVAELVVESLLVALATSYVGGIAVAVIELIDGLVLAICSGLPLSKEERKSWYCRGITRFGERPGGFLDL